MALTSSEEALVRQLLDQQAAILSLANNEATIQSKLGATKVTLTDLAAVSAVADADLLLARQGTTDKSLTAAVLAQYMGDELGSLFVNSAGDTMGGALALFGGDTGVTPAQFDDDTSLATTAFVRRALGSQSGYAAYTVTTVLTAADAGKIVQFDSAGAVTATLPAAADCPIGTVLLLRKSGAGVLTVAPPGGNTLVYSSVASGNASLGNGDTLFVASDGVSSWRAFAGSALLRHQAVFAATQALSGSYNRLPNGNILQYGQVSVTGSAVINFPIAFPSSVVAIQVTCNTTGPIIGVVSSNLAQLTQFTISNYMSTTGALHNEATSNTWMAVGY